MTPWLFVVGIGEDGPDGLSAAARAAIGQAKLLVGGSRHLDMIASSAERLVWRQPLAETMPLIAARRSAASFMTGNEPGCPRQTAQTQLLGGAF